MDHVWVVIAGRESAIGAYVLGVYNTEEKAKAAANEHPMPDVMVEKQRVK